MKKALFLVLMSLGGLFLAAALTAGVLLGMGKLPQDRLMQAVTALRGTQASPAAEVTPAHEDAAQIPDATLLEAARERLANDQESFRQERNMAHAQLEAERAEVERIRDEVGQRVEEARRASAAGSSAPSGPAAAVQVPPSEKGAKALAEIAAKMTPKVASQLFLQESEEAIAGVLKRMDPKQAAKVLSEMVSADPDWARRVAAILREGKKS